MSQLTPAQILELERSETDRRQAQLRELYQEIYPFLLEDFAHKEDVSTAIKRLSAGLSTHSHAVSVAGTAVKQEGLTTSVIWLEGSVSLLEAIATSLIKSVREGIEFFTARVDFEGKEKKKPFSLVD